MRDELWGRTEPDDYLRDKKQEHRPLRSIITNLDQGEQTGHEWDVRPDAEGRNAPQQPSNVEATVFENRWGVKAGAQTMLSHHGKFGKKVRDERASAFEVADDVSRSPWAGLADARPQISSGTVQLPYVHVCVYGCIHSHNKKHMSKFMHTCVHT